VKTGVDSGGYGRTRRVFISSTIFFAEKFVVKFFGSLFTIFGGMVSLGPPCGFCVAAQPNKSALIKKSNPKPINTPSTLFLFILMAYNKFNVVFNDYH
jgi:hypothetical protein